MIGLILVLVSLLSPARAQELPSCETPRLAAETLLGLLQPETYDPDQAAACLELPPDLQGEGGRVAVQFKQLLDARGLYVPVDELPTQPDYESEAGLSKVVLVDALPVIYLEKVGDRWLWSQESIEALPRLYRDTFHGIGPWLQERLPPWATTASLGGIHPWQVTLFALLLLVGAALGFLVNLVIRSQLQRFADHRRLGFDPVVFERTRRPLTALIMAGVLLWGAPDLQLSIRTSRALFFIARLVVGASVVLILLRWVDVFADLFLKRAEGTSSRMDDQLVPLARQAAQVVVVLLGVVFVLQNLGVDVAGLIAGLGIGGLAVALAAKDTLANVFGSITIFLDRPFHVGDWVILEDGTEGTVEQIGFRSTRVRTFYSSLVSVPNSKVANGKVDNMGLRAHRRYKTTLGLTYDTPPEVIEAFVQGVRAILKAHPDTLKESYEVHLRDFGGSALEVMLYSFLDVPDWHGELVARSQIMLEIIRLADDLGVAFAFPSTSVYLESTPEHPLPDRPVPELEALRARVESFGPGGAMSRPRGPQLVGHGFNASADAQRGDTEGE